MEGLDYGGPAVIEPRLLRPETLRRHLSVGLPFANPKALSPKALSDVYIRRTHISNTPHSTTARDFTLRIASVFVQLLVAVTVRRRTNSSRPRVLQSLSSPRTAPYVVTTRWSDAPPEVARRANTGRRAKAMLVSESQFTVRRRMAGSTPINKEY